MAYRSSRVRQGGWFHVFPTFPRIHILLWRFRLWPLVGDHNNRCYLGSHIGVTGALAQVIGYSLAAPAPPFPVFVLAYAINGFGLSLQVSDHPVTDITLFISYQDAGANGFVASLRDNAATKMGFLHAVYGWLSHNVVTPRLLITYPTRRRRILIPSRCHAVLPTEGVVVSLSRLARCGTIQLNPPHCGLPLQRPGLCAISLWLILYQTRILIIWP